MEGEQQVEDGYIEYIGTVRKRKKKSKVWIEFQEIADAKGMVVSAKCSHCNLVLVAGSNSGTSHLKRHLLRCPKRPEGLQIGDGGDDEEDGDTFVFDMNVLRNNILFYVVEGNHPLSTVDEKGFRRMLYSATPKFVPFGRATLTRDLFAYYYSERESLKKVLLEAPGHICLTTDNWKASHSKQHYICVTAHFVDKNWKLNKRILRFRGLSPPYDGENVAEEIWMFLNQWNLEHKVMSLTVDNASYNDLMISHLKYRLMGRGMLVGNGRFFHIRCCAHIINLIVQAGLALIDDNLEMIRKLVKMVTKSPSRSKEFYDKTTTLHLNDKKKLSLDMKIRWNSTFKMLDNVLYYRDVFDSLGSVNIYFKPLVPSSSDWDKLKVIHNFLKIFYEVTCTFSLVKSPTSNLYMKGAFMVHRCLHKAKNSPHEYLAEMVKPMLVKFDKYWSEYNINISCAPILDPRFKVKFVEYCLSKGLGNDVALNQVEEVLTTLRTLYNEYKLQGSISPIVLPLRQVDEHNMFHDFESFTSQSGNVESRKSQLDMYLAEPRVDFHSDLDVLEY
ncbi:unnamed protein product [Amaranthus hypochondriacus]